MTIHDEGRDEPRSRLHAQVNLILSGIPDVTEGLEGAAAHPGDWAARGEVDYHHRHQTLLVRDADVDRVRALVPSAPVAHDNNLRGLTRLEFAADERRSVEETCAHIDRALGEGVATPDHVLYVCPATACPATEPEEVPADAQPAPGVPPGRRWRGRPRGGARQRLASRRVDRALVAGGRRRPDGQSDRRVSARILPYAGHGTFVAGVARAMAPEADVWVSRTFVKAGAIYESDLVKKVSDALTMGAEVISLSFGTNSRRDIPLLGFEVVEERLREPCRHRPRSGGG